MMSEIASFFNENGYYLARGVFSPEEVAELERDFDRIVRQLMQSEEQINARWKGPEVEKLGALDTIVYHTHQVQQYSAVWHRALMHDGFLDIVEAILGPNIVLHHTKLFHKPAEKGAPFPMHQDWPYFPTEKDTMMAGVIHVSNATDEMGCFRLYPGSHKRGRMTGTWGQSVSEILLNEYPIEKATVLEAEAGELATLVFCDRERGKYLEILWRLACGGPRVDMRTASLVARRILAEEFASDERVASGWLGAAPAASDLLVFQRPEGGVALLPYADPDLELTAKIAALGDIASFDRDGLAAYLGRVYDREDETRERHIVALYGLAALGQPVLTEIQSVADRPDLSVKEKLYTCLALAALGDEEKARSVFASVLQAFGDRIGPLMRLDVSKDREEVIAATSLAAVIAAQLAMPEREFLLEYLLDNTPLEELNHLELALYLQEAVPAAPSEVASFIMEPGGTEVRLEPGETYTCVRTAEDLADLRFREVHGSV
ncbi:MAG: phytanoyl-CoA dioxygenase family protein, partial [Anaerolineae bacterium]|nr:phytanoyl-CoA dioxygenase family protein [Anaerolineae bacterium]